MENGEKKQIQISRERFPTLKEILGSSYGNRKETKPNYRQGLCPGVQYGAPGGGRGTTILYIQDIASTPLQSDVVLFSILSYVWTLLNDTCHFPSDTHFVFHRRVANLIEGAPLSYLKEKSTTQLQASAQTLL